jgi:hypothetical protein
VQDQDGELLIDVPDAIAHAISAAIWFGLTTVYLRLADGYSISHKLLPC